MDIYQSMAGTIRIRLTGADVMTSLSDISALGTVISNITVLGELQAEFSVQRKDYRTLRRYAERKGDNLERIGQNGTYWMIKKACSRPVLVICCMVLVLLALIVPERILFVSVDGNEIIPERLILEEAEECGLRIWAKRRDLRNEQIKNRLLAELPDLQWVGMNTFGCHAVITVRERSAKASRQDSPGISSIVAARDGIILSCTVTKGTCLCKVGDAVRSGEKLISGYSDLGLTVGGTDAEGEIFASTKRNLTVVTPQNNVRRTAEAKKAVYYSLIIGKKRINFYKGSGISDGSCVKMYSKYVLSLPGGYELPIIFLKETVLTCSLTASEIQEETARVQMSQFALEYLMQHMIAGSVAEKREISELTPSGFRLEGSYICTEMIGRRQEEMIGENHGKDNRTDRERGSGG